MPTFLLIIHGLLAVALLGAVTHQALGVAWRPSDRKTFFARFRGVSGGAYTNSIVILFVITAIFGGVIYTIYRVDVRILLEQLGERPAVGMFEMKEHLMAIGLGILPAYWYFWRSSSTPQQVLARNVLTVLLALIVWAGFLVGHILNNIKGFGL